MKTFVKKSGEGLSQQIQQAVQDKAIDFIKGGNVEGLAKMLEEGSKEIKFLNRCHTKTGKSSLMVAAEEGRLECVQLLLDNFVNIDLVDKSGMSALLYCAMRGEIEAVKMLVMAGADIHVLSDPQKENALFLATKGNHMSTVEFLVSKGVATDLMNFSMETPLTSSIKFGYFPLAAYLLNTGANINVIGKNGSTSLIRTGFDGRADATRFILQNGGDVNVKNDNGETALMLACKHNHFEITALLLEEKSNTTINSGDMTGKTAFIMASMQLRTEIIKMLLTFNKYVAPMLVHTNSAANQSLGVSVILEEGDSDDDEDDEDVGDSNNDRNKRKLSRSYDNNVTEGVFQSNNSEGGGEIAGIVNDANLSSSFISAATDEETPTDDTAHQNVPKIETVDINKRDLWGYSALTYAVHACNHSPATAAAAVAAAQEALLRKTQPLSSPSHAAGSGTQGVRASMAVNQRKDPRATGIQTAATAAAAAKITPPRIPVTNLPLVTEVVTLLLDNGAYINNMDRCYNTPLMYACMKGQIEVAELLLSRGADPTLTNIDNKTAWDLLPEEPPPAAAGGGSMDGTSTGNGTALSAAVVVDSVTSKGTKALAIITETSPQVTELTATTPQTKSVGPSKREMFQSLVDKYKYVTADNSREGVLEKPEWVTVLNNTQKPEAVDEVVDRKVDSGNEESTNEQSRDSVA